MFLISRTQTDYFSCTTREHGKIMKEQYNAALNAELNCDLQSTGKVGFSVLTAIVIFTHLHNNGQSGGNRPDRRLYATSGARSMLARAQAAAASSSNSSVSFFIIVPPSSSASTMVTARR